MSDPVKTYVRVADRRAAAARHIKELSSEGEVTPVQLEGAPYARGFWAKQWHRHFERLNVAARLMSKGFSFLRNNAVVHFEASPGRILARVADDDGLYNLSVDFSPVDPDRWEALREFMRANPVSLAGLLSGARLPAPVADRLRSPSGGLLPAEGEYSCACDCREPSFCVHVAAALCAAAVRMESDPALAFRLRRADPADLAFRDGDDPEDEEDAAAFPEPLAPLPLASLDLTAGGHPPSAVVVRRRRGQESRLDWSSVVAPVEPEPAPSFAEPFLASGDAADDPAADEPAQPLRKRRLPRVNRARRKKAVWVDVPLDPDGQPVPEPAVVPEVVQAEEPPKRRPGRPRRPVPREIPKDYQFGELFARLRPEPAPTSAPGEAAGSGDVRPAPRLSGRKARAEADAQSPSGRGTASGQSGRKARAAAQADGVPVGRQAASRAKSRTAAPAPAPSGRKAAEAPSGRKAASGPFGSKTALGPSGRKADSSPSGRRTAAASPANAPSGARGSTRAATRSASKSEVRKVSTASSTSVAKAATKPSTAKKASARKPATKRSAATVKAPVRKAAAVSSRKAPVARKAVSKTVAAASATLPILDFRRVSGKDIRALRRYTGLPLEAFSYKMKICKATLIRWESTKGILGLYTPSVEALKRLYRSLQRKSRTQDNG
jgi:DNA-binding transcriptional regulator YiaG